MLKPRLKSPGTVTSGIPAPPGSWGVIAKPSDDGRVGVWGNTAA